MVEDKRWQEFQQRSVAFLALLEACGERIGFSIQSPKLVMNAELPSFKVSFRDFRNRQIVLNYSEHHLDYADGISINIDGKSVGSYGDFGVSLFYLNKEVMDRFLQLIKER